MSEYLTEQEQIQQLKTWIKQYGATILIGILIATAISTGWHYYQSYRNRVLIHASAVYDEMLQMRVQNNLENAAVQANKLLHNYPKTPYAQMAAFMLARDAAIKKDYPTAITQLTWVIDHSSNKSIKEIARIRIARIHIAQKQPAAAIATLKKIDDDNFAGMIDEVRGDAFLAMNDPSSAKKAYELALKELPNAEVNRPILEMKFDNLAGIKDNSSPLTPTEKG